MSKKLSHDNGVIVIPLSIAILVKRFILSVSAYIIIILIIHPFVFITATNEHVTTATIFDDAETLQNDGFMLPNDLPQRIDHDKSCNRITDNVTSVLPQHPQLQPPLSLLFQRAIVYIDDITLRFILPVYMIIIILYIVLVLSHPYIASRKKYYMYYHRMVSSLLSFVLPGIRLIPTPEYMYFDVNDDSTATSTAARNDVHGKNVDDIIDASDVSHNLPEQIVEPEQPINMSGSYQMTFHENLDAFLAVQGVPWPLRRAASAVLPIHHIVHIGNHLSIQIVAQSSGFTTQTQYVIHGPPVETNVRGRIFSDRVYYSYEDGIDEKDDSPINTDAVSTTPSMDRNHDASQVDNNTVDSLKSKNPKRKCNGIITEKRAVTEGYIVTVLRKLVTINDPNNTKQSRRKQLQ